MFPEIFFSILAKIVPLSDLFFKFFFIFAKTSALGHTEINSKNSLK